MKRIIAVILVLLSLVLCFANCGSEDYDKYTSLISDSFNDGLSAASEIDFWTGTYFEKEDMADKTCLVYGKIYTGSYNKSIIRNMRSYTTDIYFDENRIEFGLRNDTGELAYINFMNADFFDTEPYLPEVSNPYESAISLATEIASEYVDDIAEYTQIIEEPKTNYKERDGITYEITYYFITFAKKINGYFSSDYITVKVTSKGNLASIMIGDINAFENTSLDFDTSTMNQSITNKIDTTYKKNNYIVQKSNINDQKIVLTPNGDICMQSDVTLEITTDTDVKMQTGNYILTVLGRKAN